MEPLLKRRCPGRALILSVRAKQSPKQGEGTAIRGPLAQAAAQFKGPEEQWGPESALPVALLPEVAGT